MRRSMVIIAILLLGSLSLSSAEQVLELTLDECIRMALESNLDIRIEQISPDIQDETIKSAESRFDPSLSLTTSFRGSEDAPAQGGDPLKSGAQSLTLSLTDPISTGGSYGLSFNNSRTKSDIGAGGNPSYRSSLSLNISQPLLRNRGISVNKASVTIARVNREITLQRLKSQIIRTLSDVQNAYWNLVAAVETLKVQELSLKQAKDLLKLNEARFEVDKATESDILQARSAVASREADVIAAKDSIRDAQDRLRQMLNIAQNDSDWEKALMPKEIPEVNYLTPDLNESIEIAMKNRPELIQSKLALQNSELSLKIAENQVLPALDLDGSLSFDGTGEKIGDPLSDVGKAKYGDWTVTLGLRFPLGNRSAKADLRRQELEYQQDMLALKSLEQEIIAEVRGAIRQLESDRKRIEATKAAEELARQVLSIEEEKLRLGMSTSYDLLQFQASLASASLSRLRSQIDYRKDEIAFYQILGTTLEKLNIKFIDE